jgi:hypothetical protein
MDSLLLVIFVAALSVVKARQRPRTRRPLPYSVVGREHAGRDESFDFSGCEHLSGDIP